MILMAFLNLAMPIPRLPQDRMFPLPLQSLIRQQYYCSTKRTPDTDSLDKSITISSSLPCYFLGSFFIILLFLHLYFSSFICGNFINYFPFIFRSLFSTSSLLLSVFFPSIISYFVLIPSLFLRRFFPTFLLYFKIHLFFGGRDRGNVAGSGTVLQAGRSQVRFPKNSSDYPIHLMLTTALLPWSRLSL
jgi:hypothetical protein